MLTHLLPQMTERVQVGDMALPGSLVLPAHCVGIVVFVHGSGSSRNSPRNLFVAQVLRSYGLGTLLMDLLTETEALDRRKVFDIGLLGGRVMQTLQWLRAREGFDRLPIGLFGASTGAAAALMAAAQLPTQVNALVSRGGRPDLAGPYLSRVSAPTLLIVGGQDQEVLDLNRVALDALRCRKKLEVVPGATHLFEEPGALDIAASLAGHWFERHLSLTESQTTP